MDEVREFIVRFTDAIAIERFERIHGTERELVRCKDCKHRDGSVCDYSAVWVHPNGFCHWGERREE